MLPFSVHLKRGDPAHEQILAAVRDAFATGQLRDGDSFPSAQSLTQELRVSPRVAQKVVDQLIEDGFLTQQRGSGLLIRTGGPASWVSDLKTIQNETLVGEPMNPGQGQSGAARFPFLAPAEKPGLLGMIESYEVIGLIARGGMGMVFEALDPGLMRRVAIKVLIPQLAASPEARARFLREARAAAAIDHPNVLPVYAVGECQGFPYLVMPLVVGESLHHRLKRNGPLPLDDLLRIALATARGLAAAHERNLIHRDIKPDNVLLETGGGSRVWLADFGLARAVHDSGLTRTGAIAGTPQFLSPEQAAGREVDLRSDLFSFGSMLYAMATGGPPFDERAPIAVLRRITEDSPPPPSEKRNDLPPALEDLIAHLMQKAPDDRPASALEIVESLETILQSSS